MATLAASTYTGWFTSLTAICTKHGKNGFTNSINAGQIATAALMASVQTAINTTKGIDNHMISASIDTTIPSIAQGNIILASTKSKIDSIIAALNSVCHHDSVCTYYPCSDDSRDDPSNYKDAWGD